MLEDKYITLAVGFAKWLACRYTAEQLALLSAFFNALADNLGIISAAQAIRDSRKTSPNSTVASSNSDSSENPDATDAASGNG